MVTIHRLHNGVTVVLEEIPYVRSIAFGIWVKNGSVHEPKELGGISHFMEHMMFKGTQRRSAREIAEEMDSVGGQINAYTTKEYTVYHTRTLDTHFETALDVLSDMFLHSKFDDKDIKRERNVIMEEINLYEDSAEDLVHEELQSLVWPESSLGRPILGTVDTISTFDTHTLRKYRSGHYRPDNTVLSVAGNFSSDEMLVRLEKAFGAWQSQESEEKSPAPAHYTPSFVSVQKETEQVHLLLAFPSIPRDHPKKHCYTIFNTIFGGGMSSVLFQKIREEHGLTYSVYSYLAQYSQNGLFAIYAGMAPGQTKTVIDLIFQEIQRQKERGISAKLLKKTKEQLISNFIIGNESTMNRMTSNGGAVLLRGSVQSPEETIAEVEKITPEDMEQVVHTLFDCTQVSACAVGKTKGICLEDLVKNNKYMD